MNYIHLTHTLVESFNALADEVQSLTDRKTVLEHKLRFAHEQVSYTFFLYFFFESFFSLLWVSALQRLPSHMMIHFSSRSRVLVTSNADRQPYHF